MLSRACWPLGHSRLWELAVLRSQQLVSMLTGEAGLSGGGQGGLGNAAGCDEKQDHPHRFGCSNGLICLFSTYNSGSLLCKASCTEMKIMVCRQLDYQHERIGAINAKRPLWLDLMHAASCSCCHWHAARSQLQTQVQGTRAIPCSVCKILECKFIVIRNLPAEYSKQPIWASNSY